MWRDAVQNRIKQRLVGQDYSAAGIFPVHTLSCQDFGQFLGLSYRRRHAQDVDDRIFPASAINVEGLRKIFHVLFHKEGGTVLWIPYHIRAPVPAEFCH